MPLKSLPVFEEGMNPFLLQPPVRFQRGKQPISTSSLVLNNKNSQELGVWKKSKWNGLKNRPAIFLISRFATQCSPFSLPLLVRTVCCLTHFPSILILNCLFPSSPVTPTLNSPTIPLFDLFCCCPHHTYNERELLVRHVGLHQQHNMKFQSVIWDVNKNKD